MSNIAIITGASSGIGAATAARFEAAGYKTINISRRPCPVSGVINIAGDLATSGGAEIAAGAVLDQLSSESTSTICLVHNASLMLKDSIADCEDTALERILSVNVLAMNTLNRHLLPAMGRGSSILYVGSTLSEKAVAGAFSYVVSKHAQLGMMRASCQDLAGTGIHTAMICPGFTDTEMLKQHLGGDTQLMHDIGSQNGFGRLVDPDEIAATLVWAQANPVINGSVIHANLGQKEQ